GMLTWLQRTHLLIPLLGVLAVAILAAEAPIGVVIAAVLVLIAVGVELSKHWRQIWAEIKRLVADAVDWIRAHWQLILAILTGPIGAAVAWIVTHWGQVTSFFGGVVSTIARAWRTVTSALTAPVRAAYDTIMGWFHDIASFVGSIPGMIGRAVNGALGGIPGKVLHFLGFASGGITGAASGGTRSGLTMVGEHGRELVRLPAGTRVMSNPDTERMLSGGGGVAQLVVTGAAAPNFMALVKMIWPDLKLEIRTTGGGGPYSV